MENISNSNHRGRILLAEDNPVNQRVAIGLLERKGYQVVLANDGREATEILNEDRNFDLILMDIQMPHIDGYEATKIIREREKSVKEHIPIIALTAHTTEEDRDKILAAGMDDYLAKPVMPDDMYDKIDEVSSR